MRPVRPGLERVQRLAEVVDRARQRRQVEHEVDRLLDVDPLDHVVVEEREAVVADVLEVLERARLQVVDADHPVALRQQVLTQMGAEEPRPAGHDCGSHGRLG